MDLEKNTAGFPASDISDSKNVVEVVIVIVIKPNSIVETQLQTE